MIGSYLGAIYATDPDNDGIIYSINSNEFSIDPFNGVLQLQTAFQSSAASSYSVTVVTNDDRSSCLPTRPLCPRYSSSMTLRINVVAVNERAPQFVKQICTQNATFYENNAIGNDGLRNPVYSQFNLEQEPQMSTIRVAYLSPTTSFDYDAPGATRVWNMVILATDHGTPQRQSLCTFQIHLLDLNDNAPVFLIPSWNYTIYRTALENTTDPHFITTMNVTYFTIDQTAGTIILRSDVSITDLEVDQFPITFSVYAQDRGSPPRTSEVNATVTIYYNDDISISEKYYETYGNRSIFNISIFTSPTTSNPLNVTTPFPNVDIPFTAAPLLSKGKFFHGGIIVTRDLHAHIQQSYSIYYYVSADPPLIGSVRVRLIDENDQTPTFDVASITTYIMENEGGRRAVTQIHAYDRDVDVLNNYVLYYLNPNLNDPEVMRQFFVVSNGTVWTDAVFDYESDRTFYRLIITARDITVAWNSSTGQVHTQDFLLDIRIIDLNDEMPVFAYLSSSTISIDEQATTGTEILYPFVIDADFDTKLSFGILSGNTNNVFAFYFFSDNSADRSRTDYHATAKLSLAGPLTYESTPSYTLVLFAFDNKHLATITVMINLIPKNTRAPYFQLMPGSTVYQYEVTEGTALSSLNGPVIRAIDPDISVTPLIYDIIYDNNQFNLNSIYLVQSGEEATIGIAPPGLSRNFSSGYSKYLFTVRVRDDGGLGVSTFVPVTIEVVEQNNYSPIPTNSPWILMECEINPSTSVLFTDYDDPTQGNAVPFLVEILLPSNFSLSGPMLNDDRIYTLTYNGVLNRILTKNLSVTFNASDNRGYSAITTIPIIVGDVLNAYPISNGQKTINITYIDGYMNSVRNIPLGSIYVNDLDDWFRADRTYTIRNVSREHPFTTSHGWLSTSEGLHPGSHTIQVDVTKPNVPSTALSTIDVDFSVPSWKKNNIENRLNSYLPQFSSRFGITTIASGPNPCSHHLCPTGTTCRPIRIIQPSPFVIDSNQTASIGINLLDSAQCFNTTYVNTQSECRTYPFNNFTYCPCLSLEAYAPLGPYCQVLGRTFNENGGGYAVFDGRSFSNLPPAHFSLDFVIRPPIEDGVILFYGRNSTPINDFFWIAIEIYQSRIRFHFADQILDESSTTLKASTWYHLEYLYNRSNIIVSINDHQYITTVNATLHMNDLSNVQLYLGGLPMTYPSLTQKNGFGGCIRNVLSNGYYLDMHSFNHVSHYHHQQQIVQSAFG